MGVSYERKDKYDINDLLQIMEILRSEQGCPWDREQTHASMRKDMIEEAYEVCEAIDLDDRDLLKEELGDVLLQVVHHARIEEEQGTFNFQDVCDGICKKLILRHPHVFADTQVSSTGEVLQNWEQIKEESKGQTTKTETLVSVPKTFPALMRAQKVQKRAAKQALIIRICTGLWEIWKANWMNCSARLRMKTRSSVLRNWAMYCFRQSMLRAF